MRIEFDDGTLLLRDAPDGVPHAEWDDRVDEYRAQARHYRSIRDWAGEWDDGTAEDGQLEPHQSAGQEVDVTDEARAYPDLALAQAVLYDATEMPIRVWDHFGTVFSYVKLFGLMHRIWAIPRANEHHK
jgi:hypothetical protein